MIAVTCSRCGEELTAPGGLMFSPPLDGVWNVVKFHLCAECWPVVLQDITAHLVKTAPQ